MGCLNFGLPQYVRDKTGIRRECHFKLLRIHFSAFHANIILVDGHRSEQRGMKSCAVSENTYHFWSKFEEFYEPENVVGSKLLGSQALFMRHQLVLLGKFTGDQMVRPLFHTRYCHACVISFITNLRRGI